MAATPSEKSIINTIKSVLFPIVVGFLGWMIKSDINEMKSDIKVLLAQSNIDKTKIEHLESDVQALNKAVFKITSNTSSPGVPRNNQVVYARLVCTKPEEMYDIKKYLNIEEYGN